MVVETFSKRSTLRKYVRYVRCCEFEAKYILFVAILLIPNNIYASNVFASNDNVSFNKHSELDSTWFGPQKPPEPEGFLSSVNVFLKFLKACLDKVMQVNQPLPC